MLPTNQKSRLFKGGGSLNYLSHTVDDGEGWRSPQHLYIISDDEIKENGTHFYNPHSGQLHKSGSHTDYKAVNNNSCKKIIATTDISLEPRNLYGNSGLFKTKLPQPSQQFIEKYIEEYNRGNIITDVLVEYQTDFKSETKLYMLSIGDNPDDFEYGEPTVKINPKDNTITIKKVKDSYTREEVEMLLDEQASKTTAEMLEKFKGYKSREEVEKLIRKAIVSVSPNPAKGFIDKWIEENL